MTPTSHWGGVTYHAGSGFTPSAVAANADLSVDSLAVEGMLQAGSLTEADIMAGLYDFAEVEVFMVNYADLSQGALQLKRGWMGGVSMQRGMFVAEMRGLAQACAQTIGELFSPSCRAALGDARCTVNLAAYTVSGTVTALSAPDRQAFTDSGRAEASGSFTFGTVTFTSGANAGLAMEVKEHDYAAGVGGRFTLALPMPYALAAGDAYAMAMGCDKTLATCAGRFGNVVNFRGEPHVPGLDKMLETAGTRSG